MVDPQTIWIGARHLPIHRCGGWAFVCSKSNERIGGAGGERQTTARRLVVLGLAAALESGRTDPQGPSSAGLFDIVTTSPDLIALFGLFLGHSAPEAARVREGDDDLWALVLQASKGRHLRLAPSKLRTSAPMVFADAWAELAAEKAKGGGAFRAAIPKSNLIKLGSK